MSEIMLEYDDAIDQLYRRHDGGQDTRKGVIKAADYADASEIPDLEAASLLVYLDIFRGVPQGNDVFAFGADHLLAESAFDRMLARCCGKPQEEVKEITRSNSGMTYGNALIKVNSLLGDQQIPAAYPAEMGLTREMAVSLIAAALKASNGSGNIPALYYVPADTVLQELELPKNCVVASPDNTLVTLTVDGVMMPLAGGYHYAGDIRLTLTERYELYRYTTEPPKPGAMPDEPSDLPPEPAWWNYFEEPYRAALFIENGKKNPARSIDAAYHVDENGQISISSDCKPSDAFGANNFNGIIVGGTEGKYVIDGLKIRFNGNGMDDFQGMGAGVLLCGDRTETIINHADICNYGTVRSTMVVGGAAKVAVLNSRFSAHDGFFEEGWIGGMGAKKMRTAPIWGGFDGNCRSTNLLDKAEATYIDSQIMAEKWGVLSTDNNKGCKSTAINSLIAITGGLNSEIDTSSEAAARKSLASIPFSQIYGDIERDLGDHPYASHKHPGGYGTYSIGNTTVKFAGSTVVTADYGNTCVNAAAKVIYCSSAPENISDSFGSELQEVTPQNTVLYTDKTGVMMQRGNGGGGVLIKDKTLFHCGMSCFSVKSNGSFHIDVDDSTLISESGTILQLMDDDDLPGEIKDPDAPTPEAYAYAEGLRADGLLKLDAAVPNRDVFVHFSNMTINGDCYNSSGHVGAITREAIAESASGKKGGFNPFAANPIDSARQLDITLDHVVYNGAISTSEGHHIDRDTGKWLSPVPHDKWYCLAVLEHIPRPAYQAGVIVTVKNNSTWHVTKTCYLTSLTVEEGASLDGALFVNGISAAIVPGKTYTGYLTIEPGTR